MPARADFPHHQLVLVRGQVHRRRQPEESSKARQNGAAPASAPRKPAASTSASAAVATPAAAAAPGANKSDEAAPHGEQDGRQAARGPSRGAAARLHPAPLGRGHRGHRGDQQQGPPAAPLERRKCARAATLNASTNKSSSLLLYRTLSFVRSFISISFISISFISFNFPTLGQYFFRI